MLNRSKYLPYLMWLFPLLFFTFQFVLRLWPSLMMQQIMQQFLIEASGFGFLASAYYYGYAGMQIPVAILLDRIGARYMVFGCAVLCGLATFLFTFTPSYPLACVSRFLIGVGSAIGFLGTSKVVSEWFPKDKYARMIGLSFTVGLMGALYGGRPMYLLVESHGGKIVAIFLALVSLGLGVFTYLFLRAPQKQASALPLDSLNPSHFKQLLSSPFMWFLAIANFLMVGALEGFADVWGVPYLMTAYEIEKGEAAELISFIFVGMLFGGPLLAMLSKKVGNYTVIALCGLGIATAFLVLFWGLPYMWFGIAALLFAIGVMCCYQVIIFVAGSELVSPTLLSVAIAFLNSMNMLGGSFFHSVIGVVMDTFWTGRVDVEGVRQYTLASYEQALLVIPLGAFLGACIVAVLGIRRKPGF